MQLMLLRVLGVTLISNVSAITLIKKSDYKDSSQRSAVGGFSGFKDGLTCSEYISLK